MSAGLKTLITGFPTFALTYLIKDLLVMTLIAFCAGAFTYWWSVREWIEE